MKHVLEVESMKLRFGTKDVLSDIHLMCETGKVTGLLGRNGSGKSSLMHVLSGNIKPNFKSVKLDGLLVKNSFRSKQLKYLPQKNFLPSPLRLGRVFNNFECAYDEFEVLFPKFSKYKTHKIKQLSGGLRRLVEVYLIVKSPSQFALLDEPFSHIEPLEIEKIKTLILAEKANKGFLITDHLYQHIIDLSDHVTVLKDGSTSYLTNLSDLSKIGYIP